MNIPEITPAEFVTRRDRGDAMTLLDVREGWELGVASVPGIVHIPMGEIAGRIGKQFDDQVADTEAYAQKHFDAWKRIMDREGQDYAG